VFSEKEGRCGDRAKSAGVPRVNGGEAREGYHALLAREKGLGILTGRGIRLRKRDYSDKQSHNDIRREKEGNFYIRKRRWAPIS